MNEYEIDYVFIRGRILALLETYEGVLDREAEESVHHLIDHDEYEMGYEGVFIELMKSGFNPNDIEFDVYIKIGKLLGLDTGGVFEYEFWKKLTVYAEGFGVEI